MCSLSNSLPDGIRFIAFFSSLSGDIWLSFASDKDGNRAVERDAVATADLSSTGFAINRRNIVSFQGAVEEVDSKLRNRFPVNAKAHLPPPPSELKTWMAFPRSHPLVILVS